MTACALEKLKTELPQLSIGLSSGLVESLRAIKDKSEIDAIRLAVKIAERVFTSVKAQLRPEQSEREIANEIDGKSGGWADPAAASNQSWRLGRGPRCRTREPRRTASVPRHLC